MRGLSLILMVAGAGVAPLRAQQPDTAATATLQVNLDEAIRRALEVQPAMVQARGDSRNAGASMMASNGAFLPSITASGSSARAGGTRFDTQRNQIIQLGQPQRSRLPSRRTWICLRDSDGWPTDAPPLRRSTLPMRAW